ncbi:MAG: hypothetical protein MJA29_00340 [Candidatus Omnitrophica bacterium]|nr:hypothetical protein [Candidatus Omnitrophota bacterium]
MNTINTSPKWWGFSKKPKNWKKYMSNDGYDHDELIAENSPMKSKTLTDEEIKELGLENNEKPEIRSEIKPSKPPKVPLIDSSNSYA